MLIRSIVVTAGCVNHILACITMFVHRWCTTDSLRLYKATERETWLPREFNHAQLECLWHTLGCQVDIRTRKPKPAYRCWSVEYVVSCSHKNDWYVCFMYVFMLQDMYVDNTCKSTCTLACFYVRALVWVDNAYGYSLWYVVWNTCQGWGGEGY